MEFGELIEDVEILDGFVCYKLFCDVDNLLFLYEDVFVGGDVELGKLIFFDCCDFFC